MLSRDESVSATSKETLSAYKAVFKENPPQDLIKIGVSNYQDGYKKAKEWHEEGRVVDVIFSNGDDIVAGARQYYLDNQLELPFLVGQDNQLSSQLMQISTIDYQFLEIGKKAFELVLKENTIEQIGIPSRFIVRDK
jgi:DNA-binding LacI/PurR family transcriptional regulator